MVTFFKYHIKVKFQQIFLGENPKILKSYRRFISKNHHKGDIYLVEIFLKQFFLNHFILSFIFIIVSM